MDNYIRGKNYIEARRVLTNDPLGSEIVGASGIINSKTSGLLTHVSIMIVVCTTFFVYLPVDQKLSKVF